MLIGGVCINRRMEMEIPWELEVLHHLLLTYILKVSTPESFEIETYKLAL